VSTPVELAIADIRAEADLQMRIQISETIVKDYAERLLETETDGGVAFPPIIVFFDGETYRLADGFHRLEANKAVGNVSIAADVRDGGRREALLFSLSANAEHGLQRTRADKRRAVEAALNDPEWAKLSDRDLAKLCKVTHPFVGQVRRGGNISTFRPETIRTRGNVSSPEDAVLGPLADENDVAGNISTDDGDLVCVIKPRLRKASDDQVIDALAMLNAALKKRGAALNEISRLGKLFDQRRRIAGSALGKRRVPKHSLTALSSGNDPYRQESRRVEGEWFARWFEELCPQRRIHLRGFHYLLVTSSIVKPNGEPYRNVDDEWEWLGRASVTARWLGLLPFNRIVDQRNDNQSGRRAIRGRR
jgi:hypothetical protein